MHLLVPFASDTSEACQHVLRDAALPNLERLLAMLTPVGRDEGDAFSFSPPHERALAAAWGWRGGDGLLPFAARAAGADGIATGAQAWALLTPAHWQLGRDHVTMLEPDQLALAEVESRALFAGVAPLFASEGFEVAWGGAGRWYAARDDLQGFATASPDRVIGRGVDRWLRASASPSNDSAAVAVGGIAKLVRRLQSEAQLLLYTHDLNAAREERGALAVNSFWLSGCGRAQAEIAAATPQIADGLRAPLLAGDWAAWAEAWQALDAGAIARLLEHARDGIDVTITLCGERTAARFALQSRSLWQRLRGAAGARPNAHDVLGPL
ncbi:MAG: hypothetical protein ABI364_06065 [Caldimonas sp.]